jgi:ABC-2 type transport system permease protein
MKIIKESLKEHENYKELIWMLAKMDFKLRYQGSFLGYVWAILQPLLMFIVLAVVFSGMFGPRGGGSEYYTLGLLVALMLFTFFSDGTNAGMNSLQSKAQLVTKIYVPRWSIILASTVNTGMIFVMNIIVIIVFFVFYQFVPSLASVGLFFLFSIAMYVLILSFSLLAAPLLFHFRDIAMIWSVVLRVMFYIVPIIYPLDVLPAWSHKLVLLNPVAFIIHFTKQSMFEGHYPDWHQTVIFIGVIMAFFAFSVWAYRKLIPSVAEKI